MSIPHQNASKLDSLNTIIASFSAFLDQNENVDHMWQSTIPERSSLHQSSIPCCCIDSKVFAGYEGPRLLMILLVSFEKVMLRFHFCMKLARASHNSCRR